MDALYWVAVGTATGLCVAWTEFELRRRRDVDRLTKELHAANCWIKRLERDRIREQAFSHAEIEKLHNELHALKHERVTRWKGGQEA